MPTSAVYQPTTVTYEQQPTEQGFNCPTNYFSRRVLSITGNNLNKTGWMRVIGFFVGVIMFFIGLALCIAGGIAYSNSSFAKIPGDEEGVGELVAGSILLCLGLVFQTVACAWSWATKVAGKDPNALNGGAGLTALNPSTDPLVAAQYAPVRDAPPAPDDETRNLMDNKDCLSSAEESDKMLDGTTERASVA